MFGDDSGDLSCKWKVECVICLPEDEAFNLKNFISKIKAGNGIDIDEELKPLRVDYRKPKSKAEAQKITFEIYEYLGKIPDLVIYGVCFLTDHLRKYAKQYERFKVSPIDYFYEQSCKRMYDNFDRLLADPKYPEEKRDIPKFGIIVFDEPGRISRSLLDRIKKISAEGTEYRPSSLIFWGITFTSSERNFGIEAAGFVAYALRRAINEDKMEFINPIKHKFCRTSEGYIDNFGLAFYDGNRFRGSITREEREELVESTTGEKFRNLAYREKITSA